MKTHRLLLAPLLYLGMQWSAYAADNDDLSAEQIIEEMTRLNNAGQFQAAYDLGYENLQNIELDLEGVSSFDFAYGLAALESGEPNEAVFALERVSATATQGVLRQRARLELARAYFVTNNLTASENLFNTVLATNPPANVRQNIEAFLQLIEARRNQQSATFSWTIASAIGQDGNINSATSNGFIDTPLIGQIELDPNGQETEDQYNNTTLAMNYNLPFTRDRALDVRLNVGHLNNFGTDQFDIANARGEVAYTWGDDVNRFRHGFALGQVNLDGNTFQDSLALNSSWQHVGSNGWYQSISGSYTQIRYDTSTGASNALRDVDQMLLTGGLTKIAGQFTHSMNLYHANEDPENPNGGSHNGRTFTGLAYSLLYRLNAQHTPYIRATAQDVEHDSEHPVFFNTIRSDDNRSFTAGWFYQFNRDLTITAETSYTDNSSNIELFDYSRFKYQAGIRYQF